MQSLIAMATALVFVYAIVWIKNYGYSFITSLRVLIKRLALHVISFSWVIALTTILMIACYSNISVLLKDLLSANSIVGIKSLVRLVFGVDSAFVALQMLALYSIMASFVSSLVFVVGMVVRVVYIATLKVVRTPFVEDRQCSEQPSQHWMPTFKLYLKYNS